MENNYSVEEILRAIEDLQKIKKEKKIVSVKNTPVRRIFCRPKPFCKK